MELADNIPDPLKTELETELRDCVIRYQERYGVRISYVKFELLKNQGLESLDSAQIGTNFDATIEIIV
jgi:hypothetical protein